MDNLSSSELYNVFPFLLNIRSEFAGQSFIKKIIPKGTIIFNEGDPCGGVAFVLSGSIRVSKIGKNGREIILYRVGRGESCILTVSSVLSNIPYPATASVEEEADVILVPVQMFQMMMSYNVDLQQFVYKLLSNRFLDVMTLIDEIIFRKIDERLIEFLLSKAEHDEHIIEMTHEELALQLGTAREVISRIMKGLERDGFIQYSRGKVKVMNRIGLQEKLSSF